MRQISVAAAMMLSVAVHPALAQMGIPTSVAAAETEGAAIPTHAAPASVAPDFARPFAGTASRKCVTPSATGNDTGGQLRSGEFIVRGRFAGPYGLRAERGGKFYWVPLHNPMDYPNALLIRAERIGHPDDAFRQAVADWAYPGRGHLHEGGFPSIVTFPSAGTWVVVTTAGDDWGCFVITVAPK
jgi:hypothetical protein